MPTTRHQASYIYSRGFLPLAAGFGALILLLSIHLFLVYAGEASSTNFQAKDLVVGGFGGEGTSTSFSAYSTGSNGETSGEASSTNFALRDGALDFSGFSPVSRNWRWYDDEENATPVVALADENTAPVNVNDPNKIKLRLTIKELNSIGSAGAKFKLQFSENADFSANVFDAVEIGSCVGNSVWCYADGGGADNGTIPSKLLSDGDACAGGVGSGCGTHNESGTSTSTATHSADAAAEYEFTLQQRGARVNTTYYFRAFDTLNSAAVTADAGETYPSLVTGGTTLVMSVSGLPKDTVTEGRTTSVTSTATGIPFGTLAFGADNAAAQRITVTTNATEGYQLFVYQDQGFLSDYGAEIPGVEATNASPAGWATACPATAKGCYGYHTGDDTLSTSPARFSADDTYARFETSTREIAFSSLPVTDDTVDIVFRTLIRGTQEAGNYENGISYIIVPVF